MAKRKRPASKLFTDFTGHDATSRKKVNVDVPNELVKVGKLTCIGYRTVRDGQTLDYMHEFKLKNAPILAVSPCGKKNVCHRR